MDKQKHRALRDFQPANADDKRAALRLNDVVELTDAEAEAYGDVVDAVRPYVVKGGSYTQTDADGKPHEFNVGDTILLRDAEVEAIGEEKFERVRPPAPTRPTPPAAPESLTP